MTKEENMTKVIKNILSENFDDDEATESQTLLYKNLWLEAEAALCSVSHKNRYNQMKIEMEKQSYKQRDMDQHSKSEVIPSLSRSESSAIEVNKCLNSDSSTATIPKELSQSKFSSDMNRLYSLTPEADGGQNLYNFIHNYDVSGINKEVAENDEASVMARYNVIKSRDDNSCINANDLETPSHTADILAAQVANNQNQVNFFRIFLIPGKNMADHETSVLARFHFLKSWAAATQVLGLLIESSLGIPWGTDECGNMIDDTSLNLSLSQDQLFSIHDFSPKWAYAESEIQVFIIGTVLKSKPNVEICNWSCMFGEVEVPATVLANGILCCQAPPLEIGLIPFYVTFSNRFACSEGTRKYIKLKRKTDADQSSSGIPKKSKTEHVPYADKQTNPGTGLGKVVLNARGSLPTKASRKDVREYDDFGLPIDDDDSLLFPEKKEGDRPQKTTNQLLTEINQFQLTFSFNY
ncbi:hypothetical protein RYX36_028929 [Vicia faba]